MMSLKVASYSTKAAVKALIKAVKAVHEAVRCSRDRRKIVAQRDSSWIFSDRISTRLELDSSGRTNRGKSPSNHGRKCCRRKIEIHPKREKDREIAIVTALRDRSYMRGL